MSSVSDPIDVDIEVRRRGNGYILIEHKFSVVVRSKELRPGIEELERRVAFVSADFRELGITAPSDGEPVPMQKGSDTARRDTASVSSLLTMITVGAVLASFVLLSTAPIVIALANFRGEISGLGTSVFAKLNIQPGSVIERVGRLGIDSIVKFSQTLDQVTPERKQELRAAIRKIVHEANLIVEDAKAPPAPSSPPLSDGEKR